jgi:hypothetical protein
MGTCIFDKLATSQAAPEDQAMKRNNVASELVDAMREAAEIAEGTAQPAAVHQFPMPLDLSGRVVPDGGQLEMTYMKVEWLHDCRDEPVELYSELDANRWEVRKVEELRDGTCWYAWKNVATGSSVLAEKRIPRLDEIGRDPQFLPTEISKEDFEALWQRAISSTN